MAAPAPVTPEALPGAVAPRVDDCPVSGRARAGVLIACIGNSLVADDAAGWRVGEALGAQPLPEGVRLDMLGLGGLDLLERFRGEDMLIVVDAVQLGAPVGTVHCVAWEDLPEARRAAVSVHGIGVREALEVGRALGLEGLPSRVMLVGIEGRTFDQVGGPCSPEVEAAVPVAARRVLELAACRPPDTAVGCE